MTISIRHIRGIHHIGIPVGDGDPTGIGTPGMTHIGLGVRRGAGVHLGLGVPHGAGVRRGVGARHGVPEDGTVRIIRVIPVHSDVPTAVWQIGPMPVLPAYDLVLALTETVIMEPPAITMADMARATRGRDWV